MVGTATIPSVAVASHGFPFDLKTIPTKRTALSSSNKSDQIPILNELTVPSAMPIPKNETAIAAASRSAMRNSL